MSASVSRRSAASVARVSGCSGASASIAASTRLASAPAATVMRKEHSFGPGLADAPPVEERTDRRARESAPVLSEQLDGRLRLRHGPMGVSLKAEVCATTDSGAQPLVARAGDPAEWLRRRTCTVWWVRWRGASASSEVPLRR